MNRIPPIAWLIASLFLLGAGAYLFKAGLPGLLPKRGKRRAGRNRPVPAAFQLPGLPPMTRKHVRGRHDWDGFLRHLTDGELHDQAQSRTGQPASVRPGNTETAEASQSAAGADEAQVGDEYEPRLAEQAIELPREGQGEQL